MQKRSCTTMVFISILDILCTSADYLCLVFRPKFGYTVDMSRLSFFSSSRWILFLAEEEEKWGEDPQ